MAETEGVSPSQEVVFPFQIDVITWEMLTKDPTLRAQLNDLYAFYPDPAVSGAKDRTKPLFKEGNPRAAVLYTVKEGGNIIAAIAAGLTKDFPSAPVNQRKAVIQLTNAITHPDHRQKGRMGNLLQTVMGSIDAQIKGEITRSNKKGSEKVLQQLAHPIVMMETAITHSSENGALTNAFLNAADLNGWDLHSQAAKDMTGESYEGVLYVEEGKLGLHTSSGVHQPDFPVHLKDRTDTVDSRQITQRDFSISPDSPNESLTRIIATAEKAGLTFSFKEAGDFPAAGIFGEDVAPEIARLTDLYNTLYPDSAVYEHPPLIRTVVSK